MKSNPDSKTDTSSDLSRKKILSKYVLIGGEYPISNSGQLALLKGMEAAGVCMRTIVRGNSMSPFVRDRDILSIAPFKGQKPRIGEVVAFNPPGTERLVIHRVVSKRGTGWLIKGDNCLMADGLVPLQNILGRVIRLERRGRACSFGLGLERTLIAVFSRKNWLIPFKQIWRRVLKNRLQGQL